MSLQFMTKLQVILGMVNLGKNKELFCLFEPYRPVTGRNLRLLPAASYGIKHDNQKLLMAQDGGSAEQNSAARLAARGALTGPRLLKKVMLFLLPLLFVLLSTGAAHAAFTITRTSAPTHYIDKDISPAPVGMYAAYRIVSDTDITDAWVRIENFSSASLGLGTYETGVVHLGSMTADMPMMAYFYLTGTETATAQTHDIKVYDRLPTAPGALPALATQNFTVTAVEDTIQANPNVVTALVSGPTPPTLGGVMTITVTGDTGTIGNAPGSNGPLVFTPAAFSEWPANAYQLYSATVTFSGGNTGTYYDTLYFSGLPNASTTSYVAVYTFRAITVTTAPTAVSPVAYLASGTQMKHTALDSNYYTLAALAPIQPATNTLTMSKSVNISTLPNSGGEVTYTLRLNNVSSTYAAGLDSITDALPASASYIDDSSTFDGSTIGDPVVSGANRTWYRSFVIPAASFRDLVFKATLPATPGMYTNSAYGTMGSTTMIDTTITTADSAPPTASTIVLEPPVLSKGFSPNSIAPGGTSMLTFTITNPNSTTLISGVTFTDTLPTSPAAMTLSSPSTTNTCGGTLTDNAGNPLVAGSGSVKLAGGSIAAGGSCSITVQVTAGTSGTYTNTTGAVSSTTAGAGLTANASLEVSTKPSLTKSFAPSSIPSGGTSVLTLCDHQQLLRVPVRRDVHRHLRREYREHRDPERRNHLHRRHGHGGGRGRVRVLERTVRSRRAVPAP